MADSRDYLSRGGRATGTQTPSDGRAQDAVNDPLAELARLIGQTDPFGEASRKRRSSAAQPQQPITPDRNYGQPHDAAGAYVRDGYGQEPARDYDQPDATSYGAPAQSGRRDYGRHEQGHGHDHDYDASGQGASGPVYGAPGYGQEAFQPEYPEETQPPRFAAISESDPYAASRQSPGGDGGYYDDDGYAQQAEDDDYNEPPRARYGRKVVLLAGACAVVLIGAVGTFGYRALVGDHGQSSPPPVIEANTAPTKVAPAQSKDAPGKLIYDRVGSVQPGERLVPREEQPVVIKDVSASTPAPQPFDAMKDDADRGTPVQTIGPTQTLGPASAEPKKVRTVTIRPDQPFTPPEPAARPTNNAVAPAVPRTPPARVAPANEQAASPFPAPPPPQRAGNAPLSLSPQSPAQLAASAPPSRAAVANVAAVPAGSYAVQLSSHRTEGEAQTSFRSLQSRYPSLLNGRQLIVRRADLGGKGIYYRALVGPFAAADEATGLCSQLKAAGGSCVVQRN